MCPFCKGAVEQKISKRLWLFFWKNSMKLMELLQLPSTRFWIYNVLLKNFLTWKRWNIFPVWLLMVRSLTWQFAMLSQLLHLSFCAVRWMCFRGVTLERAGRTEQRSRILWATFGNCETFCGWRTPQKTTRWVPFFKIDIFTDIEPSKEQGFSA